MTGAVVSTLIVLIRAELVLPALSVTLPVKDWAPPSFSGTSAAQLPTPEVASSQSKRTLTGVVYQPAAFFVAVEPSGLATLALMVGLTVSTLIVAIVVELVLPALSFTLPVKDWFAPSFRVTSGSQLPTPEVASLQSKWILTGVVYQPAAFFVAGELSSFTTEAEIVGFTVST